jgi:hypothetical protein
LVGKMHFPLHVHPELLVEQGVQPGMNR